MAHPIRAYGDLTEGSSLTSASVSGIFQSPVTPAPRDLSFTGTCTYVPTHTDIHAERYTHVIEINGFLQGRMMVMVMVMIEGGVLLARSLCFPDVCMYVCLFQGRTSWWFISVD